MVSKWEKVKRALGLKLCYYVPTEGGNNGNGNDNYAPLPSSSSERLSDAALITRPVVADGWSGLIVPPHASAVAEPGSRNLFRLSKSISRSWSGKTCSICLTVMKPGCGHAIFTAECSHSFHHSCITSCVKHGNRVCPVCRAKWKEIPAKSPNLDPQNSRKGPVGYPTQNHNVTTVIRRLPSSPRNSSRHVMPLTQETEPAVFDDDEPLSQIEVACEAPSVAEDKPSKFIDVSTYTEVSSVPKSQSRSNFSVLINLKAAAAQSLQCSSGDHGLPNVSRTPRAAVDLVTVLDISGSMAGTKLALLKRAMGFVIQNMSCNDRLSVIAFSSTARRLFPLSRMSEAGKQKALLAVNSLAANGGTNIAEGLRKGAKVMEERREKNPVSSIILLSDGQDTYTVNGAGVNKKQQNYRNLLPLSIWADNETGFKIPVHTFGFGADHDASLMHSISESSGGTFSFIETEVTIQDAFAQCIGGLLSVVVQELLLEIECMHPAIRLQSIRAGSYSSEMMSNGRLGKVDVGDLYAEEERDFLVVLNLPAEPSVCETALLKVNCLFKDPLTKEALKLKGQDVKLRRPDVLTGEEVWSIEVDRQQNRLETAEAITQASAAAEQGNLDNAISVLENCRSMLSKTVSARHQDRLCVALDAELKEMQERMTSRHVYEASGRAYVLSGLSSHSWQRATARGDSTDSTSLIQSYQTPSMTEMLTRSQTLAVTSPAAQRPAARPMWPFNSPKPR